MHLFGDVGAGEVNDGNGGIGNRIDAEAVITGGVAEASGQPVGPKAKIDKARPGDFRRFAHIGHIQPGDDLLSKLARIGLEPFGQTHHPVGLIIAKLGILRRFNHRRRHRAITGNFGHNGRYSLLKDITYRFHGSTLTICPPPSIRKFPHTVKMTRCENSNGSAGVHPAPRLFSCVCSKKFVTWPVDLRLYSI